MDEFLDPQALVGGGAIGLAALAFKLMYNALREEKARAVLLGKEASEQIAKIRKDHEEQIDRIQNDHNSERQRWREENNFLQLQIKDLRKMVGDLYEKVYQIPPQGT